MKYQFEPRPFEKQESSIIKSKTHIFAPLKSLAAAESFFLLCVAANI